MKNGQSKMMTYIMLRDVLVVQFYLKKKHT